VSRRKPYRRAMDGWWRRNPHFTRYMLREGTSVFLALYAGFLLIGLACLASGEAAYGAWLAAGRHPFAVLFHVLALVAALYHSVTWFAVSPKAMPPLRVGGEPVPPAVIIASQYLAAAGASVIIVLFAVAG